ncbi:arginine--tRNA ligase [Paenibacillus sp. HB172176]|uniref:arginine--tRNA ligase n=1 Tax=Paenibacillus sp. HB172176 TaxID=2493690 RepID=UPI001F0D869B|nr:arginine--tRNA ligase [Paenibacillus sp. HB172176]
MIQYKAYYAAKIANRLGMPAEDIAALMEYPQDAKLGDLALPCFRLSKQLKKAPGLIADELKEALADDELARAESQSGYLNLYFHRARFAEEVVQEVLKAGEQYGSQRIGEGKTVVIDYSSPNIAKPFHVAHLRSTVIGHALNRIHSFLGYRCVGVNHLGDWGTQFGKLIVAYKRWGEAAAITERGIDELLRLYVAFHEAAEKEPALEQEARAWFAKLEQGDPEALKLWRWFVDISLAEFQKIYELLKVSFDSYAGESFYNDKLPEAIEELRSKGLLEQDEGAWLVRLDAYDMPPALMLKQDGSSLYHTRDVAAALYRKRHYQFDKVIYVTDYAQNLHFKQWFKVVELMGYEWADELSHVAFGRVSIEGKGLSTRKGNVIKLEELLTQTIGKIREIIEERNPHLPNKEEVARQVGVGAVIFNDLSNNRIKDIDFNWENALSFEGETGPYVQYTHARACSVLGKAGEAAHPEELAAFDASLLSTEEEMRVVKALYLFEERVEQAMRKLEPSMIARYAVDLAQAFNHFYHASKVLSEDKALQRARLALVQAAAITLENGLRLIGIEAPRQM